MRRSSYLTLVLGLFVATLCGCRPGDSDKPAPQASILPVRPIRTRTQSEFSYPVTFYGRVQSARRTSLAFEIPGQITSLLFDEGETMNDGRPVARLNTSILQADKKGILASKTVEESILHRLEKGEREEVIDGARAMVDRMQAEVEQATRDRDRLQRLRSQNAVSESEYEVALFKAKSLQASLDAVKARLTELETGTREEDIETQKSRILELDAQAAVLDARLKKAVLTAPFTAHVIQRLVDEGAVVQEGQPVLIVSEAQRHEARFSVPITQLGEAKAVSTIFVNGDEVLVQCVRTISSVSKDTRTVDVVCELSPASHVIEGQTCTLILTETVETTCVELPVSALVPSVRGLWSCYRLEKDPNTDSYRVIREEVTINHTDGDRVFVETSLPDESLVISEGVHKVVPGMLVRLKKDDP